MDAQDVNQCLYRRPVGLSRVTGIPPSRPSGPTIPQPFKLLGKRLLDAKAARRKQKMEFERERQEKFTFKARPATVIHKEPFRPWMGNTHITVPIESQLSTGRRAKEFAAREALREVMKQENDWAKKQMQRMHDPKVYQEKVRMSREDLRDILKQEHAWEKAQMERVAVAKLRKDKEHKAQPIRS